MSTSENKTPVQKNLFNFFVKKACVTGSEVRSQIFDTQNVVTPLSIGKADGVNESKLKPKLNKKKGSKRATSNTVAPDQPNEIEKTKLKKNIEVTNINVSMVTPDPSKDLEETSSENYFKAASTLDMTTDDTIKNVAIIAEESPISTNKIQLNQDNDKSTDLKYWDELPVHPKMDSSNGANLTPVPVSDAIDLDCSDDCINRLVSNNLEAKSPENRVIAVNEGKKTTKAVVDGQILPNSVKRTRKKKVKPDELIEETNDKDKLTNTKTSNRKKKVVKTDSTVEGCSPFDLAVGDPPCFDTQLVRKSLVVIVPTVSYSTETQRKIDFAQDRIQSLVSELIETEKLVEYSDIDLQVEDAVSALFSFARSAVAVETSETSVDPTAVVADDDPMKPKEIHQDRCFALLRSLVARHTQGQLVTISNLVDNISSQLKQFEFVLLNHQATSMDSYPNADKILTSMVKLCDPLALEREIRELSTRVVYGHRSLKSTASGLFDETDPTAICRWEVHSMIFWEDSKSQGIIREARAMRGRYGRAVKSFVRIVEQLQKVPLVDEEKVKVLDERAEKCLFEVEKSKERRREIENKKELKRISEMEDKRKKEEAKEQKRLLKEASDKAKLAVNKTTEGKGGEMDKVLVKQPTEKVLKASMLLERQKNVMMTFIQKAKPSEIINESDCIVDGMGHQCPIEIEETNDSFNLCSSSDPLPIQTAKGSFENQVLQGDITIDDVWANCLKRHRRLRRRRKRSGHKRFKKKLYVTVASTVPTKNNLSSTNQIMQQSEQSFSEILERYVDSRIRTLSFAEDQRPAYVGTFSKQSRVISGRHPLAKDTHLFNYEYDSEASWEEEVEGEDIVDSDEENEDEEGGAGNNELVYDDFFKRDNDFGSDVDSDGEELTDANAVMNRVLHGKGAEYEEFHGIRYVMDQSAVIVHISSNGGNATLDRYNQTTTDPKRLSYQLHSTEGVETPSIHIVSDSNDVDTLQLSLYQSVFFANQSVDHVDHGSGSVHSSMPFLGKKGFVQPKEGKKVDLSQSEPESGLNEEAKLSKAAVVVDADPLLPIAEMVRSEVKPIKKQKKTEAKGLSDVQMSAFIGLVHGQKDGRDKLVNSFQSLHPELSKNQIDKKLSEIASKERHVDGFGTARWQVKKEVLESHPVDVSEIVFTPPKTKRRVRSHPISKGKLPTRVAPTVTILPHEDVKMDVEQDPVASDCIPVVESHPVVVEASIPLSNHISLLTPRKKPKSIKDFYSPTVAPSISSLLIGHADPSFSVEPSQKTLQDNTVPQVMDVDADAKYSPKGSGCGFDLSSEMGLLPYDGIQSNTNISFDSTMSSPFPLLKEYSLP